MKYFIAIALLAAAASASPLEFHPTSRLEHPSIPRDTRIVGGSEVPAHRAPYQVGIFFHDVFCGGALISDLYVLTTAQCAIKSSRPRVVLGAHRIHEREPEQREYQAAKVIIHPHWNQFVNDVALILLPERVRFTEAIAPIPLAPSNAGSFENNQARVTGWGITRDGETQLSPVLRYILNPIVNNRVCAQKLGVNMNPGQMCLSGEGKRSPCLGDGGAPVISSFENAQVLAGMVSFLKEGQCERGYPVGLTRISYYYNWIVSNM